MSKRTVILKYTAIGLGLVWLLMKLGVLKRGASAFEIAEVGLELEAFHKEQIRSLRDRARTDPKATRDLRRLLKTRIGSLERELRKVQAADESGSDPQDFIKSAVMRDLLELKGIQQEINLLPGA